MKKYTVGQLSILFGALMALTLSLSLLLPAGGGKPKEKAEAKKEGVTAQELEGVRLEGGEPGKSRWALTAKRAEADAGGEVGALYDVEIRYDARGGGILRGTAAKAQKTDARGTYLFSGGIRITRDDWEVKTPSAKFDQLSGKIEGDEAIELRTAKVALTGSGFTADADESWARIRGPVHAVLKGVRE